MEEPDDGSITIDPKQEQKPESSENFSTDNVPEHNQELPIIPLTSIENKESIPDHWDEEDNKKILLEETEPIDIVLEEGTVKQLNDGKVTENSSSMELKLGKGEMVDNDEMKSEHEEATPDLDDLDNEAPDTPYTIDDITDITTQESKDTDSGEQKLIRPRLVNPTELSCCEYCQGPVKKRRLCSPLRKFCSKACARNCRKAKKEDEGQDGQTEESAGAEGDFKMTWDDYLRAASSKAAPDSCFKHITTDVPGLKPGMKLEAVDRNNPPSYCVATVIKCVGHRVCIRYDGYGSDSSNDIWCNFQAEELHPIGWCAQNGYPLQPPKVLTKYKKGNKRKAEKKEEIKEKKKRADQRHAMFEKDHVIPDKSRLPHDRELVNIATRGVVKLFNAVSKHQKETEAKLKKATTEVKKSKVLESMNKTAFFDLLKSNTEEKQDKKTMDKGKNRQAEEEKTSSWNILRDDFMMGAKMKDWDKQDENEKKKKKATKDIKDYEIGGAMDDEDDDDDDDDDDDSLDEAN